MEKRMEVVSNITIENATIAFRNFSGKEGQFNPKGNRRFCVFLDPPLADVLIKDGWNVKFLEPRDQGDPKQAYLPVGVNYNHFPPRITLISGNGKTVLDEDSVNILDWAEIERVDLIIRPYNWEVNKKVGIKAYLKTMYITIAEDPLAAKYINIPDRGNVADDDPPPWND